MGRGGFRRLLYLGVFVRDYLGGQGELYGVAKVDPKLGAPISVLFKNYRLAMRVARAQQLSREIQGLTGELVAPALFLKRMPPLPHRMRSPSFYRYFHSLKMLGWVEPTGQEEPSRMGGLPGARVRRASTGRAVVEVPQPRRYYRLSAKGRAAPESAWQDPLKALKPAWRQKKGAPAASSS